jgi:hypothetical protein
MNKRTVIGIGGKVKAIRQIQNEKKVDGCREFGIINSTIQPILKNKTKINSELNNTGRQHNDFESLNKVTSMRRYSSGLSKRSDTVAVSGPLLTISVLPKL